VSVSDRIRLPKNSLVPNQSGVGKRSLSGRVFWGSFATCQPEEYPQNMKHLIKCVLQEKVSIMIDQTFSLEQASTALNLAMNYQVIGKIILVSQEEFLDKYSQVFIDS
jgi:NADPH:quinone reductase-like Zn-dependent oxidoreductase